ncbi:hypothetical protein IFR05_001913 [Cadophora sp. M221]|nr:hypothetical protein IFR05_001913 [Cadophora sp. M221]
MAPTAKLKRKAKDASTSSATKETKPQPEFTKSAETVTFRVGKWKKEEIFVVHKEFACHHSPVLRAGFNSPSVERLYTQKIELPKEHNSSVKPAMKDGPTRAAAAKSADEGKNDKSDARDEDEDEEDENNVDD